MTDGMNDDQLKHIASVSNLIGVGVIWYLKREQKGHNHQYGHG